MQNGRQGNFAFAHLHFLHKCFLHEHVIVISAMEKLLALCSHCGSKTPLSFRNQPQSSGLGIVMSDSDSFHKYPACWVALFECNKSAPSDGGSFRKLSIAQLINIFILMAPSVPDKNACCRNTLQTAVLSRSQCQ